MIPKMPKSPKKAPAQAYPSAREKEYQADLRRIITTMDRRMRDETRPIAEKLEAQLKAEAEFMKQDGSAGYASDLIKAVESVGEASEDLYIPPEDLEDLAAKTAAFSEKAVSRQVEAMGVANAIDIYSSEAITEELITAWVRANADLIVTMKATYIEKVEKAVKDTIEEGFSWQSLSKALTNRRGVGRSHADLIAVDQIGTLNSQITRKRQQELGIGSFKWSASADERVRPEHELIDGNEYSWATGDPSEGFPGQPIRCRCSAIPILPLSAV